MSDEKRLSYFFKEHQITPLGEDYTYRKEELEKIIIPLFLKKLTVFCPRFLNRHFDEEDIQTLQDGHIPVGWTIYQQKPLEWGGTGIAKEVFEQITRIETPYPPVRVSDPRNIRLRRFSYQLSTYPDMIQKKGRRTFFYQFTRMFKEHIVMMRKVNAYYFEKNYIRPIQKEMRLTDLSDRTIRLPSFNTPIYTPFDNITKTEEFGERMMPLLKRNCRWGIPLHNLKEGTAHHVRKWRPVMQECEGLPAQLQSRIFERIK